jgi:hypothetical protein
VRGLAAPDTADIRNTEVERQIEDNRAHPERPDNQTDSGVKPSALHHYLPSTSWFNGIRSTSPRRAAVTSKVVERVLRRCDFRLQPGRR